MANVGVINGAVVVVKEASFFLFLLIQELSETICMLLGSDPVEKGKK